MRAARPIPERPRLCAGCRVFETAQALIVRTHKHLFEIEPVSRALVKKVAPLLDGRPVDALFRALGEGEWLGLIGVLDQLAAQEMLVEQEERSRLPIDPPEAPLFRLEGKQFVLAGEGPVVDALERELGRTAQVRRGDPARGIHATEVAIAAEAGPRLAVFEGLNARALETGAPWLPVYTMADQLIVGPLVHPGASACFQCFVLRWLSISRFVSLERAFFDHLRDGAWRSEVDPAHEHSDWIARMAVGQLARWLEATPVTGTVAITPIEGGMTEQHPLARHPLCEACRPRAAVAREIDPVWWGAPLSLDQIARRIEPLAGTRLGLVSPEETPPEKVAEPGMPAVALARFSIPRMEEVFGRQTNWCHGRAMDPKDARTIAIVEGLERYCGLSPPRDEVTASYREVSADAVLPTSLPLYSKDQYESSGFRFERFSADRPIRWVRGFSLTEQRPRLLPSEAVYYGFDGTLLEETSSGTAAHSVRALALESAVLELVERDAFMIHWLNRISPPLIEIDQSEEPEVRLLAEYVRRKGYELRVAELTTDLEVPVFLAIGVREDSTKPALLVGGGSSLEPSRALERSLGELYSAVLAQNEDWSPPKALPRQEVRYLEEHADFYALRESLPHAAFLWSSPRRSPPPPPPPSRSKGQDRTVELIERLRAHGHQVIGADLTTPDVARSGLVVIRAVVPGLQPLGFGRQMQRLGGRRLYEAPVRMGHRTAPLGEIELNFDPHCFP